MVGQPLKPLRAGASVTPPRVHPPHHYRRFCIYYQPNCDIVFPKLYVHNNCVCNEFVAVRNRVVMDVPLPTNEALAELRTLARVIGHLVPKRPPLAGEWVHNYTGRKKNKYLEAEFSLSLIPLQRKDGYIKAFIKPEKVPELKDPRIIQARNARYNYLLGNYLKPIEHFLYSLKGGGALKKYFPSRSRLIAKGLNLTDRATLLCSKWKRFRKPIAYSLDASRFDAHVTNTLRVEHLIYLIAHNNDPLLQRLLSYQCKNICFTSHGVHYKVGPTRMSGDMNTALGNCLIAIMVLACVMRRMSVTKWDAICDGDDVVLIVEQGTNLEGLMDHYLDFGFEMKLENTTTDLTQVIFCQTRPIRTVTGPRMCADPKRVLSRQLVGCKHWASPRFVPHYLYMMGECELALSAGVPILQEFALMCMRWGRKPQKKYKIPLEGRLFDAQFEQAYREGNVKPLEVTTQARVDYWDAWGIHPIEQMALEAAFRAM